MTDAESGNVTTRTTRSQTWRVVQVIFLAAALIYFAVKISENWDAYKTSAANVHPAWLQLGLASLIVLGTYAILIQSWRLLIEGAGSRLGYLPAVRIWTIANLGRYIPGKVASIAALGVLARQEGVSATAAASAAILGTLINIGAGFGIVALTGSQVLASLSPLYGKIALAGSVCFVAGVIALPWILPPLAQLFARLLKRGVIDVRVSGISVWASVTINALSWFCYGWAFMVFAKGILPEMQGTTLQFVVVWTASYLVGYLAFIAPGGVGFREGAMITGLTSLGMTDAAGAAIIAVTSRLWLSVLELLPGLIALSLKASSRRRSSTSK